MGGLCPPSRWSKLSSRTGRIDRHVAQAIDRQSGTDVLRLRYPRPERRGRGHDRNVMRSGPADASCDGLKPSCDRENDEADEPADHRAVDPDILQVTSD